MGAATTRKKLILRHIFYPFLSLASKSFQIQLLRGSSALHRVVSIFPAYVARQDTKGSSRCNDLSSTLLDWLVCVLYMYIYRSRNILGGVAQSDRGFDLRGMLRPYFWIKSGNWFLWRDVLDLCIDGNICCKKKCWNVWREGLGIGRDYLIFKFMRVCYLNDYFFFSSVYSIIYIGETKKEKRKR